MTIILELSDNKEAALKSRALSQGESAEQFVQRIVDRQLELQEVPAASPATQKSLAEKVREIWSDVPAEDLAWMPADALDQIDHYAYGLPKRNV